MARRFAFHLLVVLHITVVCNSSFADEPLVIAELEAKRAIAHADSLSASATRELAAWKLTQLKELRLAGHASWQEVAEQEVAVTSATARAQAAERFVQILVHWQGRLEKLDLSQAPAADECVRLYMPGSSRLVAWIPADVASRDLSMQHLESLRQEHQSAMNVDLPSLEQAIQKAQRAVEIDSRGESETHLLRRAEIRLRMARADFETASARKDAAKIVARRIALVRESLQEDQAESRASNAVRSTALTQPGTRLVDATSHGELARLVTTMAEDASMAGSQLEWLEQELDAALDRIDALRTLAEYANADRAELDHAKQKHTDLELQIQQSQRLRRVQQQLSLRYKMTLGPQPIPKIETADTVEPVDAVRPDANIVRHWIELQQLELSAAANRSAAEAQRDYMIERLKRVEQIPAAARPPKELAQVRHRVDGVQQQLDMFERECVAIGREQQRFRRQIQSQRGDQYQLVQLEKGEFLPRTQFEIAEALIAAIGFIGPAGLFPEPPKTYPYIESTILLDCMAEARFERPALASGLLWSDWEHDPFSRNASSGFSLATDRITYPGDLFNHEPLSGYLPPARFRSCDRVGRCDSNSAGALGCGRSIFSYRIGSPSRNSFPYRSSYLYRTAFPTRSNLYSNPYARPSIPFSGLGYTTWLNATCFD